MSNFDRTELREPWRGAHTTAQIGTAATLVRDPHGRAIKSVISGRKKCATGVYASVKSPVSQPWQTQVQRSLVHQLEVDPSCVDYLMYPHRLTFVVRSEVHFFPHAAVDRADGTVEIIVIDGGNSSARYRSILSRAREIYHLLGWKMVVVPGSQLDPKLPSCRAEYTVQLSRHVDPSSEQLRVIDTMFNDAVEHPLGDVGDALGGGIEGRSIAFALIARRRLSMEMKHPLARSAPVHRVGFDFRDHLSPSFKGGRS